MDLPGGRCVRASSERDRVWLDRAVLDWREMVSSVCSVSKQCNADRSLPCRGGNAHYMTSYQRDMSACGTAGDLRDNVGASKPRRGRKPAPAIPVTAPHLHLSCGGVVGLSNLADSNAPLRAGTAAAVGHVSTANPEPFTALRVHSHDKAFHLLPENYQQQLLGYTGRNMELARTATTAAKAPSRPEWQG